MDFHGIIPALTTPFGADGAPDLEALAANVEATVDAGVHGLVGTGTMGEGSSLTREERQAVLATIVVAAGGRVPVIGGIAAPTPEIARAYAEDAIAAGAAGLMVLPPLLYAGGFEEIAGFFAAVCDAGLQVVAYNNPQAAGYDLPAELLVRLAAADERIVAVKECSGDVRRIPAILAGSEGSLRVLVGGDDWAFEGLCVGADGWISGVADVLAAECVELYDLIRARELDAARELYFRLLPMARFDMTPQLVQYYKAGMDLVGLTGGPVRAPRLALGGPEHEQLVAALALVRDPAASPGVA